MTKRRKTICIITQSHPSMNPRLVKEADALAEAGYKVLVIAPDFSLWAKTADEEFSRRPWQIVARPKFGPLAPRGVRVKEVTRRFVAKFLVKALGVSHQTVLLAAWHPASLDLLAAAKGVKADLYIAHYPAALPAAAISAALHNAHYGFDAEDFHIGDFPETPEYRAERQMVRAIEGRYLSQAAYVTSASPGIAEAYSEMYGIQRPTIVLNAFSLSGAPPQPTPRGTISPGPTIYWFSQTIGPNRGLECAVQAISLAKTRPHLYLRGTPAAGFRERLQDIALQYGARDRLHFLPPGAPSEMEKLATPYDAGLIGETGHTPNRRIALTNKLFSYLLAGIPALISDVPAHVAIAPKMREGVLLYPVDDPIGLAKACDALFGDAQYLAKSRRAAWQAAQELFNWEVEKLKLLDCVDRALDQKPCRRRGAIKLSTKVSHDAL